MQVAKAKERLVKLDVTYEGIKSSILLRQVLRTVLTREGDVVYQLFHDQLMSYQIAQEVSKCFKYMKYSCITAY